MSEGTSDDELAKLYELAKSGGWVQVLERFASAPGLAPRAARYAKPSSGWTFLHQAAYFGHTEAARVLVGAGARLEQPAKMRETPPDVADRAGNASVAGLLRRAAKTGRDLWAPPEDPALLPSSCAWDDAHERNAEAELTVAYGGGVVRIPKAATYHIDSFGRVLVGWHGTYSPPAGMDGEPML